MPSCCSRFPKRVQSILGLAAVLAVSAGIGAPSAPAATPGPAWEVMSVGQPTNMQFSDSVGSEDTSIDRYLLYITNVGGAASSEPITVTDTLPPGITTSEKPNPQDTAHAGIWRCTPGAGNSVVLCTSDTAVGASELASVIEVPVEVSESASGTEPIPLVNHVQISGGGAPPCGGVAQSGCPPSTSTPTVTQSTPPPFGFLGFNTYAADSGGAPDIQAGDHPTSLTTSFALPANRIYLSDISENAVIPVEDVKDVVVNLPLGFVGDPLAAPRCPLSVFTTTTHEALGDDVVLSACPVGSRVGTWGQTLLTDGSNPIYNLVPEHGHPAEFGVFLTDIQEWAVLYASVVPTSSGYVLRVTASDVPRLAHVESATLTFSGDPSAQDGNANSSAAFFTNPTDCSRGPLTSMIFMDSWENPGRTDSYGTPDLSDPAWKQATASTYPEVTGCNLLQFNPTIALVPETAHDDEPSGYRFNLRIPQTTNVAPELATPELKDATVTLPAGVSVSPGVADGLQACTDAQVALESTEPASCPPASQIGTVKVSTPLLEEPLEGQVFLGAPNCDPCSQADAEDGEMLQLFLQVHSEKYGVVIKIPGTAEAGESGKNGLQPGQLRAKFLNNPQLPFSELELHLKGGQRAPLANSQTCGTLTTTSDLSPWSSPETADAAPSSSFEVAGCEGDPFAPSFSAGTVTPSAGAYSPFTLTFSRRDGEQDLSGLTVMTPPGLLGKIAGVQQCPEPQASLGECGPASLIGHTEVAAGSGSEPFWVGGSVYLTGPYKGAPFGLSVVTPAVAGPFNLGNVIVRAAIRVNPNTSALTITSDPLPQIIDGVPLRIQTVNVTIDRAGFMFNPTNCDQQQVAAAITSAQGAVAPVSNPFAVAGCANLPFKPSLTISTAGKTSKEDGASLLVKIAAKPGEANVAKTDLQIPLGLPARLQTLNKACVSATFEANPAGCSSESIIGMATVRTPVLNVPLTGPMYLVSHGSEAFPDVEVVLQGEGVEIVLDGHTNIRKGITYSNFEAVPDAPFSSFEANLGEGPHSIFTTEHPGQTNLCAKTKIVTSTKKETKKVHGKNRKVTVKVKKTVSAGLVVPIKLVGQNGAVISQSTRVAVSGCPKVGAKKATPKKQTKGKRKQK
jgi:hypothetical protein